MKIYDEVVQGTDEWLNMRKGILTASEVKHVITPGNLKPSNNEKTRDHVYEIAAQRISDYMEPTYISDDMLRGKMDEILARNLYSEKYAEVKEVGFITEDKFGFTLGYSPDGLVGDDGLIEVKSRRQKYQVATIVLGEVPEEYMLQIQTGLLVSGRKWCDFISYCGGLHMYIKRVLPNEEMQKAIVEAAAKFEEKVTEVVEKYKTNSADLIITERMKEEITI